MSAPERGLVSLVMMGRSELLPVPCQGSSLGTDQLAWSQPETQGHSPGFHGRLIPLHSYMRTFILASLTLWPEGET